MTKQEIQRKDITAVILAGGKGRRIHGRDKGLLVVKQKPIIEHILDSLHQQVPHILINANRNIETYATYGYPVINDTLSDFQGPLAGISAAMAQAKTSHILTLPCDAPFLSDNYVKRMIKALNTEQATLQVAYDGKRRQPIHALIPVRLRDSLQTFLQSGGRKVNDWIEQQSVTLVDFSDLPEMFRNINTESQLQDANSFSHPSST